MIPKKILISYYNDYLRHHQDRITRLCESVIHVDKYVENLNNILIQNKNNIIDSELDEEKIILINELFKPFKIKISVEDGYGKSNGLIRGACYRENITIFVGYNIYEYLYMPESFKKFRQKLMNLIGHELVHRGQFYLRKSDFMKFYSFENNRDKSYFSDPQEIMAYAWMGIENMRSHGYDDKQILQKVKSNNVSAAEIGFSHIYISDVKELDMRAYKQFVKYMYNYLVDPIKHNLKIES